MNTRSKLIALQAISTKEVRRFTRIWVQTVLPPVITTALYFIIFGNLIGPRIGKMNGFDYMEFIIPGLIMMSVITNSYANVVSSFYGSKFQRHIEEMLISPIPNYIILLGYVSGGVTRGLLVGIAVTGVSLVFNPLNIHSIAVMLSMIVLTSILFSLAGLINGVFANSFDDISIIPTFVLTPLTYLGGIFYSISMLPEFWQDVSLVNPILYMVNAFRFGFLGISDISLWISYLISIGFIVALYLFSLHLLRTGYGIRT
ncbi:MAG: ABC transporter permease [Gammaproteobacteria bacterium]|nr:ABC transporter permease [Gammaproteobacteria bacterium]NNJ93356.1 ABC transporter permease [Halobacteria archaeon]